MRMSSTTPTAARIACFVSAAGLLAACATMKAAGPRAEATLESRSGSSVTGTVGFRVVGQKLRVDAHIAGLTPG